MKFDYEGLFDIMSIMFSLNDEGGLNETFLKKDNGHRCKVLGYVVCDDDVYYLIHDMDEGTHSMLSVVFTLEQHGFVKETNGPACH